MFTKFINKKIKIVQSMGQQLVYIKVETSSKRAWGSVK